MQVGVRWRAGDPPHRGVPQILHAAIAAQEAAYPDAASWTLTWLEGRPRCALDDCTVVGLDVAGAVSIETDGIQAGLATPDAGLPDEDDDDWLREETR